MSPTIRVSASSGRARASRTTLDLEAAVARASLAMKASNSALARSPRAWPWSLTIVAEEEVLALDSPCVPSSSVSIFRRPGRTARSGYSCRRARSRPRVCERLRVPSSTPAALPEPSALDDREQQVVDGDREFVVVGVRRALVLGDPTSLQTSDAQYSVENTILGSFVFAEARRRASCRYRVPGVFQHIT